MPADAGRTPRCFPVAFGPGRLHPALKAMNATLGLKAPPTAISWAILLLVALLWYWSFWMLFTSGGNFLSHVPLPWLVVCAFAPVASGALVLAVRHSFRKNPRRLRFHEIAVLIVVLPHFVGAAYVWWGLLQYMG